MTNTGDRWETLLAQERESRNFDSASQYIDELCNVDSLGDETRLRLLGNAIADNNANRTKLLASPLAALLLQPNQLTLGILYNLVVEFLPGAQFLVKQPNFASAVINGGKAGHALVEIVVEVLDSEGQRLPAPIARQLVWGGMLDVILWDPALETDEELLLEFPRLYSLALNHPDGRTALRVLGNMTSHKSFGPERLGEGRLEPSVYSMVILANLTSRADEVVPVMERFPCALEDAMGLLTGRINAGAAAPYVLETAFFVRNIARQPEMAIRAYELGAAAVVHRLLTTERQRVLGLQLGGNIASAVFIPELVEMLHEAPRVPETVLHVLFALTQAVEGASKSGWPEAARSDAARLASNITELVGSIPPVRAMIPAWLKASKALALLARETSVDVDDLARAAPKHPAVERNFDVAKSIRMRLDGAINSKLG